MHVNALVHSYFPELFVKWKNLDISAEIVLSSYLISVFTGFLLDDCRIVQEFWDVVLLEKWMGVAKAVLYMVSVFHGQLAEMDFNATLKFFSELKNDRERVRALEEGGFKDFVRNLRFDEAGFERFESKHRAINAAINFE